MASREAMPRDPREYIKPLELTLTILDIGCLHPLHVVLGSLHPLHVVLGSVKLLQRNAARATPGSAHQTWRASCL